MDEPTDAQKPDDSRLPWLRRPLPNRWLRISVPALIVMGGMFVVHAFTGDPDAALIYGVPAVLALVGLVIGVVKAKRRETD